MWMEFAYITVPPEARIKLCSMVPSRHASARPAERRLRAASRHPATWISNDMLLNGNQHNPDANQASAPGAASAQIARQLVRARIELPVRQRLLAKRSGYPVWRLGVQRVVKESGPSDTVHLKGGERRARCIRSI
jgi:hypothetical protein